MKLMIVDDSDLIHEFIKRMFRAPKYDVIHAHDGWEGLKLIPDHEDIELILLDVNMPLLHGLGFLEALRAMPEYDQIIVIMVSTEAKTEDVQAALTAGAQGYVTKPFKKQDLLQAIEAALQSAAEKSP